MRRFDLREETMRYLATIFFVGAMLLSGSFAAAQTTGAPTSGFSGATVGSSNAATSGAIEGGAGTTSSPAARGATRATGTTSGVTTPSLTCSQADLLDTAAVTLGCQ